MFSYRKHIITGFVEELRQAYQRTYGILQPEYESIIEWTGRLALENIANSDALYHNLEHTLLVTLVGQSILEGKHLREGLVAPLDWLHFTIALLCHDIGYVKGVCHNDGDGVYATGIGTEVVDIPYGTTDTILTEYHVDRGKLFVQERFSVEMTGMLDVERITSYIEMTRFPIPDGEWYQDTKNYRGLLRSADLIGQIADPDYLRKCPALFYEFEQIGANARLGYEKPGDLRDSYGKFYWNAINPYIQDALDYLRLTLEGKQWIANLYANVFVSEHEIK